MRDLARKMKVNKEQIPLAVMIVLTVISGLVAELSLWKVLLYLCVQIVLIYMLGKSLVEALDFSFNRELSRVFFSYAAGYCLLLVIYLVLLFLNNPKATVYVVWFLGGVNVFYRIIKHFTGKRSLKDDFVDDKSIILIVLIYLSVWTFMFFCFQANKLSAEITGYVNMFADDQFWFRESVEGTRGLPMPDFSAYGVYRYYHWFSGTWCSFLHFITGIELYDICFSLSWIGDLFLLVGGIYVLFGESPNITFTALVVAFVTLLFTSSIQSSTLTYYINHLYVSHFGYLPGTAMGTFAYAYFIKWHENENRKFKQLILCILVVGVTLGLKAPCGCIVLVGIVSISLLQIISKNNNCKIAYLVAGVLFLSLFLLIYKTLFTYPDLPEIYSTKNTTDRFSLTQSLYKSGCFEPLKTAIDGVLGYKYPYISYAIAYIAYWILSNFVLAGFIIVAFHKIIVYKMKLEIKDIAAINMVCAGYIIYTFMYQGGYSQVYFLFAVFPYGMLIALDVICRQLKSVQMQKKKIRIEHVILSILIFGGVYNTLTYYYPNCIVKGYENLSSKYSEEVVYAGSNGTSVNKRELEGLRWLRANSDVDAVIVTNLAMINDRGFTTCCYSERQAYIEGEAYGAATKELQDYRYSIVGAYFTGDKDVVETLKKEGVSYAVVFSSVPDYQQYTGEIIFENEDIKIIKI